jgi:hypothetical protein
MKLAEVSSTSERDAAAVAKIPGCQKLISSEGRLL